ncbi:hypothetical protein HD806DRAFT_519243 [Xylariaceae sp. AK1471]|nr:hypothetical protein HD806DRAFT_519243 [Xylariaceae sp. AK1471]
MFGILASASRLKPEIRLAQAVSQFEADLSNEQKTAFRTYRSQSLDSSPDPSDVMRLTAEIDHRASAKVGNRCFGPRFTNFLQGVQQFAALGDVVVGGSQNLIACGVWSLVRMSLLSIVNYSSYLEKLSTLFMNVGRSAPRYQTMALLYRRSKIHLCHQLFKFTQKSTLWKRFQSELDLWANSIKEETSLQMAKKIEEEAQEDSRFRALSSKLSKAASHQQKLATNLRVLDFCSKYDYETTWKQTRKVGNATLFSQAAEYQEWKSQAKSCTLMYTGKLGSGKSVLLANIVDNLHVYPRSKNIAVAYFFCRHDIPESLNARTVIGSLARQMLRTIPDLAIVAKLCDTTSPAPDFEKIFSLLHRALPPDYKAYFVLDGLDECNRSDRDILVEQLRKLQETLALFLCVSFRVEPNNALEMSPERFTAASITSIPDDNPDIAAFIEAELESCLKHRKLVIGDPALILEIQDALLKGSQGMFLWVALQIRSLCAMKTDDSIRQGLANLPKDLSKTFSRILRRSEVLGKPYQRRILELVTVARRPLTTEELREALSVVPGDTIWNPARLLNDVFSTLACCGSLIIADEEELTVRFVHHSVKQFLLSRFRDSTDIDFTTDNAERKMVDIIITYLSYGVFESQLSTMVVPQIMAGSAPARIIRSTLDSSKSVQSVALELLKSRKRVNYDIGKTLAEMRKLYTSRWKDEFHFFSYANSYWLQHVLYTSEQEPVMYDLLLRLCEGKLVNTNATNEDGQTLLWWAARYGHAAIVKVLLDSGKVDADLKDEDGRTLLWWAAQYGDEALVKMLLDSGKVDADLKDNNGQTLLWWAASMRMDGHRCGGPLRTGAKLLLKCCLIPAKSMPT